MDTLSKFLWLTYIKIVMLRIVWDSYLGLTVQVSSFPFSDCFLVLSVILAGAYKDAINSSNNRVQYWQTMGKSHIAIIVYVFKCFFYGWFTDRGQYDLIDLLFVFISQFVSALSDIMLRQLLRLVGFKPASPSPCSLLRWLIIAAMVDIAC